MFSYNFIYFTPQIPLTSSAIINHHIIIHIHYESLTLSHNTYREFSVYSIFPPKCYCLHTVTKTLRTLLVHECYNQFLDAPGVTIMNALLHTPFLQGALQALSSFVQSTSPHMVFTVTHTWDMGPRSSCTSWFTWVLGIPDHRRNFWLPFCPRFPVSCSTAITHANEYIVTHYFLDLDING